MFTEKEAKEIGEAIGIDWDEVDFGPGDLATGMDVEMEHGTQLGEEVNVTDDEPEPTARIAWAHLMESPEYYVALAEMEAQLEGKAEEKEAAVKTAYRKVRQPGQKGINRDVSPELKKHIEAYLEQIVQAQEKGQNVDKAFKEIWPDLGRLNANDLINLLWENQFVGQRGLSSVKKFDPQFDLYWTMQQMFENFIREQAMQWWTQLPTKHKLKNSPQKDTQVQDKTTDDEGTKVETPKGKREGSTLYFRGHRYRRI